MSKRKRGMSQSKAVAQIRAREWAEEHASPVVSPGPVTRAVAFALLLSPLVYVYICALARVP